MTSSFVPPTLMGILNVTPDSFFDGGEFTNVEAAIQRALQMEQEGASIIDIGGESSRPGATSLSEQEELGRVIPVIEHLRAKSSIDISIDTYKPGVAQFALNAGATIVNDISGLRDPQMRQVVSKYGCPVVLMHMLGEPAHMQHNPQYTDVIKDIVRYFKTQIKLAHESGIQDSQIILDPGIGFGKTDEHNIAILNSITTFKKLGYPVLVGVSRKSIIGRLTGAEEQDRLPGTLALHWQALQQGANMLRVHDVAEHAQLVHLHTAISSMQPFA